MPMASAGERQLVAAVIHRLGAAAPRREKQRREREEEENVVLMIRHSTR